MDDKWEGLLTKRTKDAFFYSEYNKIKSAEKTNKFIEEYEKSKNEFYISSWHMNNHESYLMWKAYGDRGCAIQTTYERIKTSFFNTNADITGGLVNYIDYEREQLPIGNSFWSVSHKDLPYTDEKEFRLFFWKLFPKNMGIPKNEKGVEVNVDIDILIEKIYLNPISSFGTKELQNLITDKKLKCTIAKSKIKEENRV
jgi:hypothetical protein